MAEFIRRCEEFLVEEFSPLDSQWSNEHFLSLSSNGLQKGMSIACLLFVQGFIHDNSVTNEWQECQKEYQRKQQFFKGKHNTR